MGELSPSHWLIVILVAVVLFGARRLPDAARSLGRSARILKSEISGIHDDAKPADKTGEGAADAATPQVAPATQLAPPVAPTALEGAPTGSDQPAAPTPQPEAATPDGAARP